LLTLKGFRCFGVLILATLCLFFLNATSIFSQRIDTTNKPTKWKQLRERIVNSVSIVVPNDTAINSNTPITNNEFEPYSGKIIRNIYYQQIPYGIELYDTSYRQNKLQKFIDGIHIDTKKSVLKSFLFVKEGEALNPYKLADNERILRDLNFMQDATFDILNTIYDDSVDIIVTTKDVFSIGADINTVSPKFVSLAVSDNNFLGQAQKVQVGYVFDKNRSPNSGVEFIYQKYNIANTFISLDFRHSSIRNSSLQAGQYEKNSGIYLSRPLYTSNAKWAGAIGASTTDALNTFINKDSLFRSYSFNTTDIWGGINLKTKQKNYQQVDYRKGDFLAIRYFSKQFINTPTIIPLASKQQYFDVSSLLLEYSKYNINFTKTTHIFGFGRTEDIPFGYNKRFTTGVNSFEKQQRFYVGVDLEKLVLDKKGNYYNYLISMGTNINKGNKFQDNSLLAFIGVYTKLIKRKRYLLRSYLSASVATIVNRTAYNALTINSVYGIKNFNNDTLQGNRRATLKAESFLFSKWQLLGFKIGFLGFGEVSAFGGDLPTTKSINIFSALGTGLRIRNEGLVFGTIEAKATWFPKVVKGPTINLTIASNLKVRYSGSFVRAPQTATIL